VKPNEDPTLIAALGAVATALLSHDESVMKP